MRVDYDPYGLQAHNRRVTNPETKVHTPTYYRVRSACRYAVRVIGFMLQVLIGVAICVGILMLGAVQFHV